MIMIVGLVIDRSACLDIIFACILFSACPIATLGLSSNDDTSNSKFFRSRSVATSNFPNCVCMLSSPANVDFASVPIVRPPTMIVLRLSTSFTKSLYLANDADEFPLFLKLTWMMLSP
ncbi:hypothetical protein K1719_006852 [Acacia pycnantha]|nr:hypothetical protein K1719_006852 [Acacia pycnantha]